MPVRTNSFTQWFRDGIPTTTTLVEMNPMSSGTLTQRIDLLLNDGLSATKFRNMPYFLIDLLSLSPAARSEARLLTIRILKAIDTFIQFFSGALFFAAMQYYGETKRHQAANEFTGFLWGVLATIGRVGLWITQILANAIRIPFAIASGTAGFFIGLIRAGFNDEKKTGMSRTQMFWATISDALWPFAPAASQLIGGKIFLNRAKSTSGNIPAAENSRNFAESQYIYNNKFAIHAFSITTAILLVALLATGTISTGPAINNISHIIGMGLNGALNGIAAGIEFLASEVFGTSVNMGATHIVAGGAGKVFGGLPILNGIASWLHVATAPLLISKQALIATMFAGGLSKLFSNFIFAVRDNCRSIFGSANAVPQVVSSRVSNHQATTPATQPSKQKYKSEVVVVNNNRHGYDDDTDSVCDDDSDYDSDYRNAEPVVNHRHTGAATSTGFTPSRITPASPDTYNKKTSAPGAGNKWQQNNTEKR